jgi:hypothetical protein
LTDEPIARLLEEVILSRQEMAVVLFALDVAFEAAEDSVRRKQLADAPRLITGKLWPELDDLLDEDNED